MRRNYCLFFTLSVAVQLSLLVMECQGKAASSLQQAAPATSTDLSRAMGQLKKHINKTAILNADQINQQSAIIQENIERIGQTSEIISQALDFAAAYESSNGPLFINKATRGGFPRKPAGGLELDRTIFAVQQGLIDHAYTPDNLKKFKKVFDGAAFKTSSYFPDGRPKG